MAAICDVQAHNFTIDPDHLANFEKGMVLCMVYRQCLTVAKRTRQTASWDIPEWARTFKVDAFHGKTVQDIVAQNDFEEPIRWNSEWLGSRRALAESLAAPDDAKSLFLARMLVFHTGSSELFKLWQVSEIDGSMDRERLQELRRRFAIIVADHTKEVWELFS